ncbi:MAG: hypothetical protein KBC84_00545, partial [Proteobacteria bacterium]|nr:hypothetical protein [Pseudomonadota bacterium]
MTFDNDDNGNFIPPTLGGGISNENINYTFKFTPRRRRKNSRTAPSFVLTIPVFSRDLDFVVKPESGTDRFAKNLALSTEVQTGDSDFDGSFYVDSESPQFVKAIFSDVNNREVIKILFAYNITEIRLSKGNLSIKWTNADAELMNQDASKVTTTAQSLNQLAKKINDIAANYQPDYNIRYKRYAGYSIVIFLFVVAIIEAIFAGVSYPMVRGGDAFVFSLNYSLPAIILISSFLYFFLKGRSSSHKELLISIPVSLISLLVISYSSVEYLNGALDRSPQKTYYLKVTGKYITHSGKHKSTNYHIKTQPISVVDLEEKFKVYASEYNRV